MTETMQVIKDLMRLQHISQRDMAEKVGVAEATMSRWMNGTRNPDIQYVEKMAEICGCKLKVAYVCTYNETGCGSCKHQTDCPYDYEEDAE